MNGALFNLGFDEVGQTLGKKLLISREKQTQKQITINIQFSGTIMGQVSALRKLVGAESYEIHEAKNIHVGLVRKIKISSSLKGKRNSEETLLFTS